MIITLEKSSGRAICRNPSCKRLPEYINEGGRIKSGNTCAVITMDSAKGWARSFYCRDCINDIYINMKTILNPKLWSFL